MLTSCVHLKKNFRGTCVMSERAMSLISKTLNLRLALDEASLVHEDINQLFLMFLHLLVKLYVKR